VDRRAILSSALAALAGACAERTQPTARAQPQNPAPTPGPALAAADDEAAILRVIDDVGRNQRQGNMLVPEEDGRLLRVLAASSGAKSVVEIGTSVGYSGLWLALALRTTGGRLTTFDIDPERLARARDNFERARVASLVTTVLGDAHEEVQKLTGSIDLVFLDADKEGYLDYLRKLRPRVRVNGLIVAHNMVYPTPDPRFVEAITRDPGLETVFLNMQGAGVAVTLKKA
jgi:caffeoyl-CoA O-methyltransferase